ncbi:MAG TPA: hypothetical protein VMG32_13940, partial [Anaeromyxobacteraceae bacterium]|nr:hypothetical protein [Anaeromyxobacteraceae bacterium]
MLQRNVIVMLLAATVLACAASTDSPTPAAAAQAVGISISPTAVNVAPGGQETFSALVTGAANTAVTWSVLEGAAGGTITSAGVYTAPGTAGTYHVVATSQADSTASAAAVVTVAGAPTVVVAVSPATASVLVGATQQFSASVTGTSDTAVVWSVLESSGCGSVTQAGLYTAPAAVTTCHVVATSHADATKSDVATVTVTAAPVVAVAIAPKTASVVAGATQQFSAIVTGTSDTAVLWSVQEASACGSVSASGLYTAPAAATTCHVVATSHADGTKSDVATVTVTVTPVVAVAIAPKTASVVAGATQQFSAIVTGTSDTAVLWSVQESSGCGSVSASGLYTAPAAATTCHVVATSHADG